MPVVRQLYHLQHVNSDHYQGLFHRTLKGYQEHSRFTDVDLYCAGGTVVSAHLSLLTQLSPTIARISAQQNAVCCCKCWGAASGGGGTDKTCHTTGGGQGANSAILSISLPEVDSKHLMILVQLIYTGRVDVEDEFDRAGLFEVMDRLDFKMNKNSLISEAADPEEGNRISRPRRKRSAAAAAEVALEKDAMEEEEEEEVVEYSPSKNRARARSISFPSSSKAAAAVATATPPDPTVDSAGRKECSKCGKSYNVSKWYERHFRSCKGSGTVSATDVTAENETPVVITEIKADCESCGVTFVWSGDEAEQPKKCRECLRKSFLEASTSLRECKSFRCTKCRKSFPTETEFHTHCNAGCGGDDDVGRMQVKQTARGETGSQAPQRMPIAEDQEKEAPVTDLPAAAKPSQTCAKCGKTYHRSHHYVKHIERCGNEVSATASPMSAAASGDAVKESPLPTTPSSSSATAMPSPLINSPITHTCNKCGRIYANKNRHHFTGHVKICGNEAPVADGSDSSPFPPAIGKSAPETPPAPSTSGSSNSAGYTCADCGRHFDSRHAWHYNNHVYNKHGKGVKIPSAAKEKKRRSVSAAGGMSVSPVRQSAEAKKPKRDHTAVAEKTNDTNEPTGKEATSMDFMDDIPQLQIVPRRRETKKPARYNDFETGLDEQKQQSGTGVGQDMTGAAAAEMSSVDDAVPMDTSGGGGAVNVSAAVDGSSTAVAASTTAAAADTCFVCKTVFLDRRNFSWHVTGHFQKEIVDKYLPEGTDKCTLCPYSSPKSRHVVKHVSVTHQKLREFIPEEEAVKIFKYRARALDVFEDTETPEKTKDSRKTSGTDSESTETEKPKKSSVSETKETANQYDVPPPKPKSGKRSSLPASAGVSMFVASDSSGDSGCSTPLSSLYECHICNLTFYYPSPYKGHMVSHYREQLRTRLEDCSKDGKTCPECSFETYGVSDLIYHVARVHDYVYDYLPKDARAHIAAMDAKTKSVKKTTAKKESAVAAAVAVAAAAAKSRHSLPTKGSSVNGGSSNLQLDGASDELTCQTCAEEFGSMIELTRHMTMVNCEKRKKSKNDEQAGNGQKEKDGFYDAVDFVSDLVKSCPDCDEHFEGEEDEAEHKENCPVKKKKEEKEKAEGEVAPRPV